MVGGPNSAEKIEPGSIHLLAHQVQLHLPSARPMERVNDYIYPRKDEIFISKGS